MFQGGKKRPDTDSDSVSNDIVSVESTDDSETPQCPPARRRLNKNASIASNSTITNNAMRRETIMTNAIETMQSRKRYDTWDSLGNFVATNARDWHAEFPLLAAEFRQSVMQTIVEFNARVLKIQQEKQTVQLIEKKFASLQ